jgi:hypothetical protein
LFIQAFDRSTAVQVSARGAQIVQEERTAGSQAPAIAASGPHTVSPDRPASSLRDAEANGSSGPKGSLSGRSTRSKAAELFEGRSTQQQAMHSDSKTSRSEGGNNDNNDAEAGTAERRRSGAEAGVSQPEGGQSRSSQAESGQPAGPGRTVRLIRGPGGRLIRTPVAVDIDNDDDELPQQRSGAVRADNLGERLLARHPSVAACNSAEFTVTEWPSAFIG